MYFLGKHILIAVYAVTLCITMRYYLRLLEQNSWDRRNYFALLGRENLRWLPLLFILIPSAALFLGYQTLGMGLMLVYLLGIQLLFGRRTREGRKRKILLQAIEVLKTLNPSSAKSRISSLYL